MGRVDDIVELLESTRLDLTIVGQRPLDIVCTIVQTRWDKDLEPACRRVFGTLRKVVPSFDVNSRTEPGEMSAIVATRQTAVNDQVFAEILYTWEAVIDLSVTDQDGRTAVDYALYKSMMQRGCSFCFRSGRDFFVSMLRGCKLL